MLHQSLNLNRFKKRERTQNWAYEEKRFLLDLCKKDMSIIENKRLDADLTALKNRAWKIIHQEFTKAFGSERNCNRLKEQWRRMKACTRAEIMDYHHRLSRYGEEVADKKRPSPFTFEIWDFMQEAKKLCRSEALEGVDYSKVQLSLEADGILPPDNSSPESDDETPMWQKVSQNMCEVEIKEEESDEQENDVEQETESEHNDEPALKKPYLMNSSVPFNDSNFMNGNSFEDVPSLSINNVAATLDTLNLIKNGHFGKNQKAMSTGTTKESDSVKQLVELQMKEHVLRMEILQIQLQTAKYNRDIAELNKMIALRNFASPNGNGNISQN